MPVKEQFKILLFKVSIFFRLFPDIYFTLKKPLKKYELRELLKRIKFSENDVILDIGCGSGIPTLILGKKCKKVIGIDISETSIKRAKFISGFMRGEVNSEFRCVKLENAMFENECFDKIFSVCVIEHIPNFVEVLKEAYRILKKNGQMIFSVDSLETIKDKEIIAKHKKGHFVEKYFEKEELKAILEQIGFKKINTYSILKTDFAKKLFIYGINNRFQYGYLYSIFAYILLIFKEKRCSDKNKGIYIVTKCYK